MGAAAGLFQLYVRSPLKHNGRPDESSVLNPDVLRLWLQKDVAVENRDEPVKTGLALRPGQGLSYITGNPHEDRAPGAWLLAPLCFAKLPYKKRTTLKSVLAFGTKTH